MENQNNFMFEKQLFEEFKRQAERDKSLNRTVFLSIVSWSISIILMLIALVCYPLLGLSELHYRIITSAIAILQLIVVVFLNVQHNIKYNKKTRNSL